MSDQNALLQPEIAEYLQTLTADEPEALKQLAEATQSVQGGSMRISAQQAQLMQVLLQMTGAKTVLELGMFTGYSALAMALVLPEDGQLITCDRDMQHYELAEYYWAKAGVASIIQVLEGDAITLLNETLLPSQYQDYFDWVFIDADKANYPHYVQAVRPLIRPGGVLALDNTLFFGNYVHHQQTQSTQTMAQLNQTLRDDDGWSVSTIPIGGGLTLAYKLDV